MHFNGRNTYVKYGWCNPTSVIQKRTRPYVQKYSHVDYHTLNPDKLTQLNKIEATMLS